MCGAVKVWRPEFDKEPRAKAVILVGTRGRESMNSRSVLLKTGCIVLLTCAQLAIAQNGCEALKGLKLDHAAIVSAKWAEAGPVQVPAGFPPKIESIPANKHCEITAVSRPTSDSEITFTLWLPAQEAWNGKYLQLGNGGWAGSIQVRGLIEPMGRGYAVSETDDGHQVQNPLQSLNPSWAAGHPEKQIDFGYRALHETAILSKTIVQAYYTKTASRAYFQGCSDGGREALMEAERYPEDFDGIIAGAPANNWTHHFTGLIWNEIALNAKPESKITPEQLPAIEKAALAACDTLDGVKDGLIEDPRKCHFDPSVLLCHGASSADCLTQPQIEALKQIYAGPTNPRTGEQIYPGFEPGTEAEPGAWLAWILPSPLLPIGSIQAGFGNGFYSQVVFEDPHWDWHTMDFDRDVRTADEKTAWFINAYNPDLRSFRDHGGKLIQYHGWGDAAIAPRDSINFYEKVTAFLARYPDPRSTNPADVQGFYRLFMVPGMGHCGGGPGPTDFGNGAAEPGTPVDADHDVLMALDRWVTQGVAPDKLIGTGKIGADAKTGSAGVRLTRPLCAYPKVAHYKGQGDTNVADNFECVQERRN
jgi:feruloyl esterase